MSQIEHDRVMTINWASIIQGILEFPEPQLVDFSTVEKATQLLRSIESSSFTAEYLLEMEEEVIHAAQAIVAGNHSNPLLDVAEQHIDDSVWDSLVQRIFSVKMCPDPGMGGEFI